MKRYIADSYDKWAFCEWLLPEERLANAVITKAVDDYVKELRREVPKRTTKRIIEECEEFFQSGLFEVLTDLDGYEIMLRARDMAKERTKNG